MEAALFVAIFVSLISAFVLIGAFCSVGKALESSAGQGARAPYG